MGIPIKNSTLTDASSKFGEVTGRLDKNVFGTVTFPRAKLSGAASGFTFEPTLLASSSTNPAPLYATWQAYVAAGVLRHYLLTSNGAETAIVDSKFNLKLPDGTVIPDIAGGLGTVQPGPAISDSMTNEGLSDVATGLLQKYGLTPTSIKVFRPLHAAIAIYAVVADKSKISGTMGQLTAALMDTNQLEGFYVEVDSSTGEALSVQSGDLLAGVGSNWAKPGFDYLRSPHG